jgi:DNA-binding protein H-NS
MRLQAQIAELQAQLEEARKAEFDATVHEMRERIEAFGITQEQLFPATDAAPRASKRDGRKKYPPQYEWQGKQWSGRSTRPQWLKDALAAGTTLEQMRIKPRAA